MCSRLWQKQSTGDCTRHRKKRGHVTRLDSQIRLCTATAARLRKAVKEKNRKKIKKKLDPILNVINSIVSQRVTCCFTNRKCIFVSTTPTLPRAQRL